MPTPSQRTRHAWVDAAKGLAILLVVGHHAVQQLYGLGMTTAVLEGVNFRLGAYRMPLLLLASGLFAARTLDGPWRPLLDRRVAHYSYLYVVWSVLLLAFLSVVPGPQPVEQMTSLPLVVDWLVVPRQFLWFLVALAVYSVVVRLLRPLPLWLQLGPALALSVLMSLPEDDLPGYVWRAMAMYFVYFLVGVRLGPQLLSLARRVDRRVVLTLAAVALPVLALSAYGDLEAIPGVSLLTSCLVVATVSALCVVAAPTVAGRALAWVGERTLPVYLLHVFLLTVLTAPAYLAGWRGPSALGFVLLPVLVAAAVGGSFAVHRLLVRVGFGWLFRRPLQWSSRPRVARTQR